jgi:hypothetical protein
VYQKARNLKKIKKSNKGERGMAIVGERRMGRLN